MNSINITNRRFDNRRNQNITTLFRFIELFFLLLMISRFSLQVPFSFKLSAVFSPRFVFVFGNVIVITLFLKSGSSVNKPSVDFCADYVEKSIIESQRREIESGITVGSDDFGVRKICRSRSDENLRRGIGEKQSGKLRRSANERSRKISPAECPYPPEEMSGEEFRRAVEAFIERQQKFLREEELC